jgi:uncharacterized protein YggE
MEAVLKIIKNEFARSRLQNAFLKLVYDYEKKKTTYNATQTVEILLRDLSQYDELMEGLVNQGINRIDNVIFSVFKISAISIRVRKLAMKDAKLKAEDYVSVFLKSR